MTLAVLGYVREAGRVFRLTPRVLDRLRRPRRRAEDHHDRGPRGLAAAGVRSVAAPLRDHEGRTVAAVNVCVHAAEHSVQDLAERFLPLLLDAAASINGDLAERRRIPHVLVEGAVVSGQPTA